MRPRPAAAQDTSLGPTTGVAALAQPSPAPASSSQLIAVNAPTAGSTTATLTAWERRSNGAWAVAIGPMAAHVGGAGIGPASEGSTHTPAGTFALTQAFGRQPDPGTLLPYFQTDANDWWDENPSSATYNMHVRRSTDPGGASENLFYSGSVYDYVVNMNYNMSRVPGAGSGMFLHVTDGSPTAGCVAVSRASMVALLRWLDPARHPYIYNKVGVAWSPDRPPIGAVDSVAVAAGRQLTVSGWAADPASGTAATQVHVYVTGAGRRVGYAGTFTALPRADVARAYPWAGPRSGFSRKVPMLGPGANTVCVYAIARAGTANPLIGCRTVVIHNPFGHLDRVTVTGSVLTAAGWAIDPGHPRAIVQIHLYDLSAAGRHGRPGYLANLRRADVGRVYPQAGPLHGFVADISPSARGSHQLCAFAIASASGWSNPLLGCRTVAVR